MLGDPLPLCAGLDAVHLADLVLCLLLPVGGLGLLHLCLVPFVPILQLLLCLQFKLLHGGGLFLVLLHEPRLLLLLPLPHVLGLLLVLLDAEGLHTGIDIFPFLNLNINHI